MGATRNTGIWLANPTDPSSSQDPVNRFTSQDWPTVCIQVPIKEISCPLKKSWKLRCRRARPAACQRNVPASELFWMELLESATFHLADDAVLSFAPLYREHSPSARTARRAASSHSLVAGPSAIFPGAQGPQV